MVKRYFLSLCLIFFSLSADTLDDVIASFMDSDKYGNSQNLIEYLFSPRADYYKQSEVDTIRVLDTLNNNGLLELFTREPRDVELIFHTDFNPLVSLKVINESLSSMGYSFFLTKKIVKSIDGLTWHIGVSTQNTPNPVNLDKRLQERGCYIENVSKNNDIWTYKVNTEYAKISALTLPLGIPNDLNKPLSPYIIDVLDAKKVTIRSNNIDFWYPKVTLYDSSLNLLQKIEYDSRRIVLRVDIPEKTKYIKIEDAYTLDNIKRGLRVVLD